MQDWRFYCFYTRYCLELCNIVCFCGIPQTKNHSSKHKRRYCSKTEVCLVCVNIIASQSYYSQKRYKQRADCMGRAPGSASLGACSNMLPVCALMSKGVERRAVRGAKDRETNKGCSGWQHCDMLPGGAFSWVLTNHAFRSAVSGQRSVYTLSVTKASYSVYDPNQCFIFVLSLLLDLSLYIVKLFFHES